MADYNNEPVVWVDNGAVEIEPGRLPKVWNDLRLWNIYSTGGWPALLELGWYPYQTIDPGSPDGLPYYDKTLGPYVIGDTIVTRSYSYTQWDIDRVKQAKIGDFQIQVTNYTANQIAVDTLLSEDIRMDESWVETNTIAILKLSDWNAVANYDTTKPQILVVSQNYQGQRYVSQGLAMQSQNDTASSAGLGDPWDQVELNSFIAANEPAAQDITGNTAAVDPTYKIRQGTVTPADRFSGLLVYRSERLYDGRQTPDPSLEMVLDNKQDDRKLYAFIYLQPSTYLEWVEFIQQENGSWAAHSSVNILSWIASDLQIILSYGTNQAVQQDYFTNPMLFDAGGEQITLRVRWDTDGSTAPAPQGRGRGNGLNR